MVFEEEINIAYACMGREGGCCPKSTLAYSQGGRVRNSDFFAYVLNEWSLQGKLVVGISALYRNVSFLKVLGVLRP